MPDFVQTAALACAAAIFALPAVSDPPQAPDARASGALDGMTFLATITVAQYDAPFSDRMTFANGTFFSEECQRRCDFGAHPYETRIEEGAITFIAEMTCSEAPQSVRWEGRITAEGIEGTALWRVERFYWTVERHATFTGTLVETAQEQAAIRTE